MSRHMKALRESHKRARIQEKKAKRSDNSDFLPGALAILETPPSPLGRWLMWIIIGMLSAALLWACLGQVDIVAVAQGRVIPDGRIKVVQASEQGVVSAIHVRDGDTVKAGQSLVELDATVSEAELQHARQALITAQVDRARAESLVAYAAGSEPAFEVPEGADDTVIATQNSMIAARIAEYRSEREAAAQELAQQKGDKASAKADVGRLQQQLPLAEDQLASLRNLESKGYAPRLRVLDQEEKTIGIRQDLAKALEQSVRADAAILAASERLAGVERRFNREALDELNAADAAARLRREELNVAEEKNRRTVLESPTDGVVQQLQLHTIGAVVKPADSILIVVPQGATLIVEANVLNRDIGFVREGQDVRVKMEAFPFTRHGVLEGRLTVLSQDAVQDEKLGLVFPARIELAKFVVPTGEGKVTRISPGMTVSAEVKTGQRRIIEFLLSPLTQATQEAARER